MMNIDNGIQVSTHFGGLRHFQMDDRQLWALHNALQWPTLMIPMDLGSDGQAGISALEYKYGVCVKKAADPNHGCQRDQFVVLRELGYYQFWLLLMVSINMPYGPNNTEERLDQFRNKCKELSGTNPRTNALFMARSADAIMDLSLAGVEMPGEKDKDLELWDYWVARGHFRRDGYRCNLNRFQGGFVRVAKELQNWSLDLFEAEHVAIEMDMLKSKALMRHYLEMDAKDTVVPGEEGAMLKTSVNIEDKQLRKCADNAIIIRVMMLGNEHHKRTVKIILSAGKFIVKFHTEQNRTLRSAEGNRKWVEDITHHGLMNHVYAGLKQLEDVSALEHCEFDLPVEGEPESCDLDLEIMLEDEFAQRFGQLSAGFAAARIKRCLFYLSYPWRFARLGIGDAVANETLGLLKKDLFVFKSLKELPGKTKKEEDLINRSVFNLVINKKWIAAAEASGFKITPAMAAVAQRESSLDVSTQYVEEYIGLSKNSKKVIGVRKYRRPEMCLLQTLHGKLLSERHKYTEISTDRFVQDRTARLAKEAFTPSKQLQTMPFEDVVTTSQNTNYYSPSATNATVRDADVWLLRRAAQFKDLHAIRNAWLGRLLDYRHELLYRYVDPTNVVSWVLPLTAFKDSAVACLQATLVPLPGSADTRVEFKFQDQPIMLGVFKIDAETKAMPVRWRSWKWQWHRHRSLRVLTPGIRLFTIGPEALLMVIACHAAFWHLDQTFLTDLCKYLKIPITSAAKLLDVIWAMCKHFLAPISDWELLQIIRKRVSSLKDACKFADSLLHLDEAVQLLDHHDHEQLTDAQRKARNNKEDLVHVANDYADRVKNVRNGKGKGKGKGTMLLGGGHAHVYPKQLRDPGEIAQGWGNQFKPPGSSIWKGLVRGEWWGHLPPENRVFHRWADSSEFEALKFTLRDLWRQYNFQQALPAEQCPIKNLFDAAAPPA